MEQKTQERIQELKRRIFGLQCGDDLLFSNGNGNLPLYNQMEAELNELEAMVKQIPPPAEKTEAAPPAWSRTKIKCVESGLIFDNLTEASKAMGCGKSAMSNHLAGRFPHLRGLHFERVVE